MARPSSNSGRSPYCAVAGGGNKVTRGVSGQDHERKQLFGMGVRGGGWLRPALAMLLVMSCAVGETFALDIAYCSNFNTGTSYSPMVDTFQSNGLCQLHCVTDYAFAILQGPKCWCSNYIPSTETSGCTQKCGGYDTDFCGNTPKGLFGYIALISNAPSGTLGPTSTVRTTSTPPAASASSSPIDTTSVSAPPSISTVVEVKPGPTKTLIITTTESSTSTTSTASPTSSSTTTTTTASSSTTPTSTSTAPTSGSKAPTPTAESTSPAIVKPAANSNGNFFSNPGRVAGLFIGIIVIIIAIIAGLLFFCYRRNRRRAMHGGSESGGGIPAGGVGVMAGRRRSRSLSTLGLIAEKGFHSGNTGPATGPPDMAGLNGVAGTKLVDQRLDPSQLYLRYDPDTGSSRMSVRSLRDDADYSRRVLRLANPDD